MKVGEYFTKVRIGNKSAWELFAGQFGKIREYKIVAALPEPVLTSKTVGRIICKNKNVFEVVYIRPDFRFFSFTLEVI